MQPRIGVQVLLALMIVPVEVVAQGESTLVGEALLVPYRLAPSSELTVHTRKGGLFGRFGHEHDIRAAAFDGVVLYHPADLSQSHVTVTIPTSRLEVVPAKDSADIPKITETMRTETLRVDSFPEIRFQSRTVELREGEAEAGGRAQLIRVSGDLTMVGQTRPVSVTMTLRVDADTLRATGSFVVKQTDFGIRPFGTALGTVKVKNEVTFHLSIVAIRETD